MTDEDRTVPGIEGAGAEPVPPVAGPEPDDAALQTELQRTRLERDAIAERLAAARRRAARERDRFEASLEASTRRAEDRGRALKETREELLRLRRQPIVRIGRRLARVLPRRRRPEPPADAGSTAAVTRPAPATDPRGSPTPSIAIHIGPATMEVGMRWGDVPFARAVQAAFEGRGWAATVHAQDGWDDEAAQRADVSLHLFGVAVPPVRPGQVSLLWVISHPDRVTARLCEAYDVVFVASDPFREALADRIATPVVGLHQATDPDRFFPEPGGEPHELLFVGNSRRRRRAILDAVAATGHDLAVYGSNWTPDLLDPRYLRGAWIPNDELHRSYSSAGIVLSDHWPDMRDEGFISNRVYDALASGGFVLSDRVPGMDQEFDGAVATYEPGDDLGSTIDRLLADPEARRAAAERGRAAVLARHTFGHRVDAIIASLDGRSDGVRPENA
jgi:hypothetical protein